MTAFIHARVPVKRSTYALTKRRLCKGAKQDTAARQTVSTSTCTASFVSLQGSQQPDAYGWFAANLYVELWT